MKKIILSLFSLIMVLALTVSPAIAASGAASPGHITPYYPPTPPKPTEKVELEKVEPIDMTSPGSKEGYAVLYDSNGKPLEYIKILTTVAADRFDTGYKEIETMLDNAYKQVLGVEKVEELTKEITSYESKDSNFVISDLFDVSAVDGKKVVKYGSQYTIAFKLRLPIKEGETTLVLHNYSGDKWEVIENAEFKGDLVTISTKSLSPFAIVRDSIEKSDDQGTDSGKDRDKDKDKDRNKDKDRDTGKSKGRTDVKRPTPGPATKQDVEEYRNTHVSGTEQGEIGSATGTDQPGTLEPATKTSTGTDVGPIKEPTEPSGPIPVQPEQLGFDKKWLWLLILLFILLLIINKIRRDQEKKKRRAKHRK